MSALQRWMVVGGDGLVGKHLMGVARSVDRVLLGTGRRSAGEGLTLDLERDDFSAALSWAPDVAFLCAAVTSMQQCRDDPARTHRINVENTVKLAAGLLAQGCFVIFLSSNTVFDGLVERPAESEPYQPVTEYGRQKVAAESALRALPGAAERLAIVRLSKVVVPYAGLPQAFLESLRTREPLHAFSDLMIAPVSLAYVGNGLLAIASRRESGVFHLSGQSELSYSDCAFKMARYAGLNQDLVVAVHSSSTTVEVLFRPEFPALGMPATQDILGIAPEPIEDVLAFLLAHLPA